MGNETLIWLRNQGLTQRILEGYLLSQWWINPHCRQGLGWWPTAL